MEADREAIPDDVTTGKQAVAIQRAKELEMAAELTVARAKASEDQALIVQQNANLERHIYRSRSERSSRLIEYWR
ncbi:protein of unknown function [Bradyrhizobium vignae]|uniref:Uncharacterized protein n=1 Tax=Bradyrhizobium vignae TaxID=1549949 RepID=A0A2U3Q9Z8_9BRAD|nr:protein of unknown function [Bradyrhizobium vignae]